MHFDNTQEGDYRRLDLRINCENLRLFRFLVIAY